MTMMASKLRELSDGELENHIRDMAQQIWKIRFQLATGQAEGVKKLRSLRRDFARVKTVLRERELKQAHGK